MNWLSYVALVVVSMPSFVGCAQSAPRSDAAAAAPSFRDGVIADEENRGDAVHLVTLYKHDPFSHTVTLETGAAGHVVQDFQVKNHGSDIDFGHYADGMFSVGIEGGKTGVIVDLGSDAEFAKRHGIAETVGGGQGFAAIHIESKALVIGGSESAGAARPVQGVEALTRDPEAAMGQAKVELGHMYVMRLRDRHDASFDRIYKFIVVDYVPDVRVTLRYARVG